MEGLTKFPKLYFYTKANLKIGYGHLIRQSILAKFLKNEKLSSELLKNDVPKEFVIEKKLFKLSKLSLGDLILKHKKGDKLIIIIDRYDLTVELQKKLLSKNIYFIVFDNVKYSRSKYILSNIVININPYIKKIDYKKRCLNKKSTILTGLKYAIVREPPKNKVKKRYDFLVILGGGNNKELIHKIIKFIENNYKEKKIFIISGFNQEILVQKNIRNNKFIIKKNIKNPSILMNKSKVLICSGGTTLLESLYFNIKRHVVIVAGNQEQIVKYLLKKKFIINFIKYTRNKKKIDLNKLFLKKKQNQKKLNSKYFLGSRYIANLIKKKFYEY